MRNLVILSAVLVPLALFGEVTAANGSAEKGGETVIASPGVVSPYVIALPERPDPAERYAADELREHVRLMTGVSLPVVAGAPAAPAVVLSSGSAQTDGFEISLSSGNLILRGESPRGTLYAVYELLERFGGCGWYAPWRTVVPRNRPLAVPAGLKLNERPAFLWRQPSWYQVRKNPLFAARCRLNGETPDGEGPVEDPKYGGHPFRFVKGLYSSHTFYVLVPPEVHFKDHPDWFSEVGGRRLDRGGQLCVSNPEVIEAAARRALEMAAADPSASVVGVSQMDWSGFCECAACRAIREEEESLAGPLLRFVNAVAEKVEKVRPDLQVETLVYWHSLVPPKKTRPRRNVLLCCCVDSDYTEPLATAVTPWNCGWKKKFETWTDWTQNVILWDYTPNFTWHHVPHPNVDVYGPNLRYYLSRGVKGVYMDGLSVPCGSFGDLKCWLLAKLAWNPNQSADALIDRFFVGCYGDAAPLVRAVYEGEKRAYAAGRDVHLPYCTSDRSDVYTDADLDRALGLWRQAEDAVADDADALFAVRLAKYSSVVLKGMRLRSRVPAVNVSSRPTAALAPADRRVLDEEVFIRNEAAHRGIVLHHSLARGQDERLKSDLERLRAHTAAVPPASRAVVEVASMEIPRGDYSGGVWNERTDRLGSLEDDVTAAGGKAFRLALSGDSDAVTWRFGNAAYDPDRLYRVRLHLRAESGEGADGEALRAILWEDGKGGRGGCEPRVSSLSADWSWVDVGTLKLAPALKFVIKSPRLPANAALKAVYVDALEIEAVGTVQVVVPPACGKAVRAAADAFADCYAEVTGFRPVVGVTAAGEDPVVRISEDPAAFDGVTDAYRLRSVGTGLEIVGRNGRSALYGVYDFFRRRCGAAYFWDVDTFEKSAQVDLSGLDVLEQSRFEYRGCQYFAHRGLTRFQAEHWGFEDWKREIDWALKNRLNLVMLRIGIEDLFQLAFPDIVPYPDPDVTQPTDAAKYGYNFRTPFWSLQYRHLLRRAVMDYATDRGLMHPAEYGTLSHWFARTPQAFLDKMKPAPLPQANNNYAEPSGYVWDIRQQKWCDMYWKLTEASIDHYGYSGVLFNPGFDERVVYSNREDNVRFKIDVVEKFNREAARRHPDAKLLMEGWDFYFTWKPEEVARFAKEADPSRTLIFDFTADGGLIRGNAEVPLGNNFTRWGITNAFPYVFGYMLELNPGNDIRCDYAKIRAREEAMRNDPMCKGYVIWPEASHTDVFGWRYFTDNCWNLSPKPTDGLLADFCRDRYGRQAETFLAAWRKVTGFSHKAGWSRNMSNPITETYRHHRNRRDRWFDRGLCTGDVPAADVFAVLERIDWEGTAVRRDAIDLARTTLDRFAFDGFYEMMRAWYELKEGRSSLTELKRLADREVALVSAFADLLALHADFSITETLDRMSTVEKVRNPKAEHLLFENSACEYCRSHHAEWARGWYLPLMREIAGALVCRAEKGDFSPLPEPTDYLPKLRAMEHPIRAFAPDPAKRTKANYLKLMEACRLLTVSAAKGQHD